MAHLTKRSSFAPALLLIAALWLATCGRATTPSTPASLPATRPPATRLPAIASPTAPLAGGVRAEVTYVIDGDTIEVELDGREYRLRYIGVDAPERDEPDVYKRQEQGDQYDDEFNDDAAHYTARLFSSGGYLYACLLYTSRCV